MLPVNIFHIKLQHVTINKILQLVRDSSVIVPVLREIVKLVGVDHHKHQHRVDNHRQPEAIHHGSPNSVRELHKKMSMNGRSARN
jgi:hypothetical protein